MSQYQNAHQPIGSGYEYGDANCSECMVGRAPQRPGSLVKDGGETRDQPELRRLWQGTDVTAVPAGAHKPNVSAPEALGETPRRPKLPGLRAG